MKKLSLFIFIALFAGLQFSAGQQAKEQADLASGQAGAKIAGFSSNCGSDWDVSR